MFEVHEHQCGADEIADSAGAERGVLEGGPSFGEEGEAAFAEAAKRALQGVVGAIVDAERVVAGGLLEWYDDAVTCALVAGVGQDGHGRGVGVDGGQDVAAGGFDVGDSAGFDVAGPDGETVGFAQCLDVSPEVAGFAGEPGVDGFAFHAGGLDAAPIGVEDLAVEDEVGDAVGDGAVQCLVEAGGLAGQDVDDLVQVAVGGGLGEPECDAVQADVGLGAEPGQGEQGLIEAGQAPGALRCAPAAALPVEQAADIAEQFTGDVEHGRIGDHVEPSRYEDLVVRPLLPEAPRLFSAP